MALHKVSDRERLKARHEPYWHRIDAGAHLGYRKITATSPGSWVVKHRDTDTGKRSTKSLGTFEDLPANERFTKAQSAALEWLKRVGVGGKPEEVTVEGACKNYVKRLQDASRDAAAKDAEGRFERWVYGTTLGRTKLGRLKPSALAVWRDELIKTPAISQDKARLPRRKAKPESGHESRRESVDTAQSRPRSSATVNRDMTAFRAALNQALEDGYVSSDAAWKTRLRPIANAGRRRDIYLDSAERLRLVNESAPDLAAFLRVLSMLPLRPGAVANLKVGDFDRRLSTITVGKDKAGKGRKLTLPPAIASFFEELSTNKLPSAPLLTRAGGSAWNKDTWKYPVKDAIRAAGLPEKATAYALRHSAITDLLSLHRLDTATVAALSGTSMAMIERHYAHLLRDHAAAALDRLVI